MGPVRHDRGQIALSQNDAVSTIDSMLERRPRAPVVLDETGGPTIDVVNEPGHVGEKMKMTVEEVARVHADVYGRKPAEEEMTEERIAALAREVGRIPPERKRSLQRALKRYPLLLVSSPHAKLLLQADDFDAEVAARRMVKYWEQREAMFGARAFSDGVFREPTYSDYCKYYERCNRAILDPDLDDYAKEIARKHIHSVNAAKIVALDHVIEETPAEDKAAFSEAQIRAPDVVGTDEEKLLFLASEDFIEANAVCRLMRYYDFKRELFGPNLFHRNIMLADVQGHSFDQEQDEFLRISPGVDKYGRSIFTLFPSVFERDGWTDENFLKFVWYVLERFLLERVSLRQNGIVVLLDYRSMTKDLSDKITPVRNMTRLLVTECFPFKVRAIHVCMAQAPRWQVVLASFLSTFAVLFKKRVVVHSGKVDEYQRALEERFGIPADQVPQELGGRHDLEAWKSWVRGERK